jgi:hypothetical protein
MAYRQGITNKGLALFTKILAGGLELTLTRVTVGKGVPPAAPDIVELETLIDAVAEAASTAPVRTETTADIMIEYRNDMNGGLAEGFGLSEIGLFAADPDEGEILLYYLGLDPPQPIEAYEADVGALDGHRFAVSFALAADAVIVAAYPLTAYMTAEDVRIYIESHILPGIETDVAALIETHNVSSAAHPSLRSLIETNQASIRQLQTAYENDVQGLNWRARFDNLSGLTVAGLWNRELQRMEF